MLCTIADIKTLLQRDDADDDALLTSLARMASDWLANWVGRYDDERGNGSLLEYFDGREETHPGDKPFVRPRGYPIYSVPSLKAANALPDLADADELVADEDYRLNFTRIDHLTNGRDLGRPFTARGGFVRFTYYGGWWPAENGDAPPSVRPVPAANRDACALLAFHLYQNKDHFGQQSFQVGTAEITQVVRDIDGLLGAIKAAFGHLRPVPIG
jgi:hypothetical protein